MLCLLTGHPLFKILIQSRFTVIKNFRIRNFSWYWLVGFFFFNLIFVIFSCSYNFLFYVIFSFFNICYLSVILSFSYTESLTYLSKSNVSSFSCLWIVMNVINFLSVSPINNLLHKLENDKPIFGKCVNSLVTYLRAAWVELFSSSLWTVHITVTSWLEAKLFFNKPILSQT